MRATELIEQLTATLKAPRHPSLDGIVAGPPDLEVTGIATCGAPSIDALQRAIKAGCNFVLADGHPFYNYAGGYFYPPANASAVAGSPVGRAKTALINETPLVIARLTSAWSEAMPAASSLAFASALGFENAQAGAGGGEYAVVSVPRTSLKKLAARIASAGQIDGIRLDGRSDLPVAFVAIASGLVAPDRFRRMFADTRVDAIVGGEVIEWEGGPYFHDANTLGRKCGLILTGFAPSLDPTATALAAWVQPQVPALRVMPLLQPSPIRTIKLAGAR